MKNYNNIEVIESGLKCDNPRCDWKDKTILFDDYKEWINAPCPKCGMNVLTEKDYENAELLRFMADVANSISPEKLNEIGSNIDVEEVKNDPMFKNVKGVENLDSDEGKVSVVFDIHKKIKIKEIKKDDDDSSLKDKNKN